MRIVAFLSAEDERELAERWRRDGDVRAMHRLIESHRPLARKIAARYRWTKIDIEDLEAEANVGLLEAAKRFEPERGHRFSTFATFWVLSVLKELNLRMSRPVRLPGSRSTGMATHFEKFPPGTSLDEPVGDGMGTIADFIPDTAPLADEVLHRADVSKAVNIAVSRIPEREQAIIRGRVLTDEPRTLDVLGMIHGVSKERIRQLESRALARLAPELAGL